jgi:hypothetical protein
MLLYLGRGRGRSTLLGDSLIEKGVKRRGKEDWSLEVGLSIEGLFDMFCRISFHSEDEQID